MPPDRPKVRALRALGRVPLLPGPPPSSEWPAPTNLFEKAEYCNVYCSVQWINGVLTKKKEKTPKVESLEPRIWNMMITVLL